MNNPTVVLAYSGGLDTSVIVPWLRENYHAQIVCYAADVGQGQELAGLEERARAQGAASLIVEDLREPFVRDFVFPTLRAGAVYARKYLLGTSMARPLIGRRQAEVALAVGAHALAHGCTGKGNDQVRFELAYGAFAPELRVIAPWREWELNSREDLLDYCAARGIEVHASREKIFSRDRNLWHVSHEGGPLEDPGYEPDESIFMLTASVDAAPAKAEYVEIFFENGTPVAVDGEPLGPVDLLERLNEIAGRHGVGRADIIEDRLVGMKSRGIYETPGGTLLYAAHRELEQLVLDRRTLQLKDELAIRYADIVYEGRWWSLEREALDALVARTQERVNGSVKLKLQRGNATPVGRWSPDSLYDAGLASFGDDGGKYTQSDAAGFIRVFGLAGRVENARKPGEKDAEIRTLHPQPSTLHPPSARVAAGGTR